MPVPTPVSVPGPTVAVPAPTPAPAPTATGPSENALIAALPSDLAAETTTVDLSTVSAQAQAAYAALAAITGRTGPPTVNLPKWAQVGSVAMHTSCLTGLLAVLWKNTPLRATAACSSAKLGGQSGSTFAVVFLYVLPHAHHHPNPPSHRPARPPTPPHL